MHVHLISHDSLVVYLLFLFLTYIIAVIYINILKGVYKQDIMPRGDFLMEF